MSLTGLDAIEWLAAESTQEDPAASSHWEEFHRDFQFLGTGFDGLKGFGGNDPPYVGIRGAFVRLLQRRFRAMGQELPRYPEFDRCAEGITRTQGRAHDIDVMRQSLTLSLIGSRTQAVGTDKTTAVIGDGFGSMTTLLLATRSAARVVLVNLSRTLLVDLWYIRLWMGTDVFEESVHLVRTTAEMVETIARTESSDPHVPHVIALRAQDHGLIPECPLDLALNMVSFQEMDPPVIGEYFDALRTAAALRPLVLYCCNREDKRLPDGTVTRFAEYPWSTSDQVILDELCPWHQEYYSVRPPFYRAYDGPIRHRIVAMSSNGPVA